MRWVSLLLVVSSCLFPDLGPLSGADAGGNDGAPSDVVTNDVATDAQLDATNDAPPSDAGLDVKASPCATQHTFCDDFDDGSLGATWDNIDNSGGTLSQTTSSVSAPYAFQAQVPGGGGHPYAVLQKYFPASQHVHFECDLMIVGSQTTNFEIDYFDWAFKPTGYTYGNFNLERFNGGGTVEEIATPNGADASAYHDENIAEQLTSWKHLVVDIDYTKATFTMSVDGATVDAMSMTPPLASAQATLAVGVTYTGGLTSQWSVLTDNVVVDLQ